MQLQYRINNKSLREKMKIHFTNLFGQSSQSVALMAQNDIMNVVRELGVNELGIYFYDQTNEPAGELNSRMDGILAGVAFGDIVFVQSPSWNGIEWDNRLVDKLKLLQTKLVMFIHDVPPLMFESNYYLMPAYIEMYNKSDLVVVPSEQMYHRLVSEGLTVKKYVVQKLWDLTHSLDLYTPQFEKKLIFSGNPSRFPHIIDWKYDTPLHVYTINLSFCWSSSSGTRLFVKCRLYSRKRDRICSLQSRRSQSFGSRLHRRRVCPNGSKGSTYFLFDSQWLFYKEIIC